MDMVKIKFLGISDEDVFDNQAEFIDNQSIEYYDDTAESTKTAMLPDGNSSEVIYSKSQKNALNNLDIYTNADKTLTCQYDSVTGVLLKIQIGKELVEIGNFENEENYKLWIEQLLASYKAEALSEYAYTSVTDVVVTLENGAYQEEYDGFYNAADSKKQVSMRTACYTKKIGDFETTDEITVTLHCITGTVSISFDEHKFDGFEQNGFSEIEIEKVVSSYLENSINCERYSFGSATIVSEKLAFIDNCSCLWVTAEVCVTDSKTEGQFCVLQDLIITNSL